MNSKVILKRETLLGERGRKLYLNNSKNQKYLKKEKKRNTSRQAIWNSPEATSHIGETLTFSDETFIALYLTFQHRLRCWELGALSVLVSPENWLFPLEAFYSFIKNSKADSFLMRLKQAAHLLILIILSLKIFFK